MGNTAGPPQGIGGSPDRSGRLGSGPPSSYRSGTLAVGMLGSAPYLSSSFIAGRSSVYAAHQKAVAPVRPTLKRSRLQAVSQGDFRSGALGSAPALRNASASSR